MQLRNKFWIYSGLYLAIILHYLVVNGLRILPPSSSDESFKINPTASLNVNRSLSTLPQRSLENVNQTVSHSTLITTNKETGKEISTKYARGRSIVSSLSEQASNFGKGLLNFFRGSPPSHWRPPLPHPSVLRPYPHLQRRPPKGPMPHFNPAPPGMGDTDRVGPTFLGGPFQGGFLPSKKIFGLNPIKSSSSSTLINTTKVMLVDPKAPCDFYTDSLCIESYPYPEESLQRLSQIELPKLHQMMAEVQQNANVLVDGVTVQEEVLYTYEHYYGSKNNNTHSYRDYGADGGYLCPSDIRYAQLKRAKNANGKWKVIVNFDDFIQTVRLEKCLKPYTKCSYVFSYLNSECVQVYNYQRLVSWEQDRGFHVDIYKVPTSCSCHLRSSLSLKAARTSDTADKKSKTTEIIQRNLTSIISQNGNNTSIQPSMDLSRFHLNSVSSPGSSMPRTEMVEKHHQMKPLIISLPQNVKEPKQVATSQSQRIVSGTQNDRTPPYFRRNYQNYNINSLPRTKDSVGYQEKAKQPLHTPGKVGEQSLVNTPEFQESLYQRERNVHHAHHYSMHPSNDHSLNPPNVENTQHVNYNTNPISEFIHPWNDYRRQESK